MFPLMQFTKLNNTGVWEMDTLTFQTEVGVKNIFLKERRFIDWLDC